MKIESVRAALAEIVYPKAEVAAYGYPQGFRVELKSLAQITVKQLMRLSEILGTDRINIGFESGGPGGDYTPADPDSYGLEIFP